MTGTDRTKEGLDALLAEMEAEAPVSEALTARLLADAAAVQPSTPAAAAPRPMRLRRVLGGWPTLGGLVAAGLAGVWIGAAPPPPLEGLADTLWYGAVGEPTLDELIPDLTLYLVDG
ncbi:MAG: hypothetical protein ACU0CO_16690 [Shimia sp.]